MATDLNNIYSFTGKELLCTLLLRENLSTEEIATTFFSKEEIVSAIYLKYLKNHPAQKVTEEELINWLKEKYRYDLLTDLIKTEINKLIAPQLKEDFLIDMTDDFILKNLKPLLNIICEEVANDISIPTNSKKLPPITDKEFNLMLKKFLKIVDPSLEWLTLYQEALKENRIIYLTKDDLARKENLYKQFNLEETGYRCSDLKWNFVFLFKNSPYLIIERENTIKDFWTFTHEFAHFIELQNNDFNEIPITLNEYNSTTYEQIGLSFLADLGYSKDVLNELKKLRNNNTFRAGVNIIQIFNFMKKFLVAGKITKQEEVEEAKKAVALNEKLDSQIKNQLKISYPWLFSALEYSAKVCDDSIFWLLSNPNLLSKSYPYILGNYLANLTIDCLNSEQLTFLDLKKITENISSVNPYDLFVKLGVDVQKLDMKKTLIKKNS